MVQDGRRLTYRRDGNAFFVTMAGKQAKGATRTITVYYHGRPTVAVKPPWDGGLIWARDPDGRPWISTACQGLGASVWWPTKDTQADEPDSQRVAITAPDSLQVVANGRLRGMTKLPDGWATWEWFVTSPINNYDVAPYIGRYAQISDTYAGEGGLLTLDLRPLEVTPRGCPPAVGRREADAQVFRELVRAVPLVSRRLPTHRGPPPGHGTPERRGLREWLPERLPWHRSLGHGLGAHVGLHRDPRERARVVGQQHHDGRHRGHVGTRELRELLGVALHGVPVRHTRGGGLRHGNAEADQERSADRRAVRRERGRAARHVLQGRQHAAHHPPGRRERQHVARGAARRERDLRAPGRDRAPDPGVHERALGRGPAPRVPAVSHDHQGADARVPARRLDAHLPLGGRRARVRHADPRARGQGQLDDAQAHGAMADGDAGARPRRTRFDVDENYYVFTRWVDRPGDAPHATGAR